MTLWISHLPVFIFSEREVTTIYGKLPRDLEDVKGPGFFSKKSSAKLGS